MIIVFTQTDYPEPIVPATSKCGSLARSATYGVPDVVLPNASGSRLEESEYSGEFRISFSLTICGLRFGISTPTAALPGIGAIKRICRARRARANSSAR